MNGNPSKKEPTTYGHQIAVFSQQLANEICGQTSIVRKKDNKENKTPLQQKNS